MGALFVLLQAGVIKYQFIQKMSKEDIIDVLTFLEPFGASIMELVMTLRENVWNRYPLANELIYDNYNALAVGWSPTTKVEHTFCSIAVGRVSKNVHFGFYWGSQLSDPEKILLGKGKQYRYILVTDMSKFPQEYIDRLIEQAYILSLNKVKDPTEIITRQTIVKSVSEKKREKKSK